MSFFTAAFLLFDCSDCHATFETRTYSMGRIGVRWGLLVIVVGAFAGCEPPGSTSTSEPGSEAREPAAVAPIPVEQVNLVKGDEKKFAELLAAHKGQVVFVDFWALWCPPCVEFFPHTSATHQKYKDRGLATIAVNFDLLEEEPNVRAFLAKNGANFENLISSFDDISQEVATAFEFEALPEFRLYDKTGKLRKEWIGAPEDGELEALIEELLAEKAE
jgi:thiol-disulfide isomerase/thioredoxin